MCVYIYVYLYICIYTYTHTKIYIYFFYYMTQDPLIYVICVIIYYRNCFAKGLIESLFFMIVILNYFL